MEIDITDFVTQNEPSEYSASAAELGQNAGRITWQNACREAAHKPLLTTPEHFDALRQWAKETGAWDADERAAWSDDECNALFIQLVSGDMREMGLDDCDPDEFNWDAYLDRSDGGGNIYIGDIEGSDGFGRWFYNLGS